MVSSHSMGASPLNKRRDVRHSRWREQQHRGTPIHHYPDSDLLRVTKNNPCPICGHTKYCTVTSNGFLALCMWVSEGAVKVGRNNCNIHVLGGKNSQRPSASSAPSIGKSGNRGKTTPGLAPSNTLNEVYSYLLSDVLGLRSEHADHLIYERGMGDTTILRNSYASTSSPTDLDRDAKMMREAFGDALSGVPGFFRDEEGLWQLQQLNSGILVPYRNQDGEIIGLQVRQDRNRKPKYYWVSTYRFSGGTSPGSPLHFSAPHLVKESGRVILTEGGLKGDIITELSGFGCLAMAGVNTTGNSVLVSTLKESFPNLAHVVLGFDSDWKTNKMVKDAVINLTRDLCDERRWEVEVWHWDNGFGKGLDDFYNNKGETTNG